TGHRIEEMATGDERAALIETLSRLRAGDTYYVGEHQLTSGQGSVRWAELTLAAVRDPLHENVVRQILVLVNDIDARKQAELERSRLVRELQEGIRARDDFLSIAAHELKTPVTPIRLQTQSLVRSLEESTSDSASTAKLLRRLATIDRAAERLEILVERLL